MSKQQTAVEWLVEMLNSIELLDLENGSITAIINKAKEMEITQKLEFWVGGITSNELHGKNFDQYYKETYGK